ncbi:MAG: hypothetical protein A2W03_13450 [Candidatus Aminicenantes bacterium RBG_16_63_16]|nr:MAG: hypothetical protein A2W03_13450 [Candidatus Aminicenantes bacterium RBG_16_63_16]
MRLLKPVIIALLATVIVGVFPSFDPVQLVKIQKSNPRLIALFLREQIDVVQELQTCFLARADRNDIAALRDAGAFVEVIERNVGDLSFILLPSASAAARAALGRAGRLAALEPGILLFWTETGDPAALIPAGLAWKPLPSTSLLPFLRPYDQPAAESVGLGVRNDIIDRMVAEASSLSLRSLVQKLQDFRTRYTAAPGCDAAGQYIYSYFVSLGLSVRFQDVPFTGGVSRNVVAELPGRVAPGDVLIICGHYDSYSDQRLTLAPGADDDASGTAAAMEAARILSRYPLDFTVRFIAFTAEELGLVGSKVYAQEVRSRGENIIGVLNLDMIAYADRMPEDLEIISNTSSAWLSAKLAAVSGDYGLIAARRIIDASILFSDHAPFWDRGYPAVCVIEDNPLINPEYHKTTDTIETLNFDFYTQATRAALATLAELAQPIKPGYPATPTGLTATPYLYVALFGAVRNIELNWAASSGAVGYNVYRSEVSHLNYQKLNAAPLTSPSYSDRELAADTAYFYVVTAVGPTGLESNNSSEVESAPPIAVSLSSAPRRLSFSLGGAN